MRERRCVDFIHRFRCIGLGVLQIVALSCNGQNATAPPSADASAADAPDTTPKPASLLQVELALTTTCTVVNATPDGTYIADCVNGCTAKWTAQMKGEQADVTCAAQAGKPWAAPCTHPHTYGDGAPAGAAGGVQCWQPPSFWCPGLKEQLELVACNAANECCNFPNECTPCGWKVYAAGSEAGAVKGKLPCPDPAIAEKMRKCAICGDILVCPPIPN